MKLNAKKTKIVTMRQGIDFLGFHFYLTDSGKVVQLLSRKSIVHHRAKLKKMKKLLDRGECSFEACKEAHQGWRAHAERGRNKKNKKKNEAKKKSKPNTYYLVKKMDELFNELFAEYIKKEQEEKNGTAT